MSSAENGFNHPLHQNYIADLAKQNFAVYTFHIAATPMLRCMEDMEDHAALVLHADENDELLDDLNRERHEAWKAIQAKGSVALLPYRRFKALPFEVIRTDPRFVTHESAWGALVGSAELAIKLIENAPAYYELDDTYLADEAPDYYSISGSETGTVTIYNHGLFGY